MNNKSLFSLLDEEQAIMRELIDAEGEVTASLEASIKKNNDELARKIDRYYKAMDRLEAEANLAKERAKKLKDLSKSLDGVRERIKNSLKLVMKANNLKRLEGYEWAFSISRTRPSVSLKEGVEPKDLPERIRNERITYSLDKLEALKVADSFPDLVEVKEEFSLRPRAVAKRID